ncbi:MAG: nucleoside transporter, partial [Deltaproteobacteria bacterium]|nr:nucleoside transporter [Deltaproteobacteria bacterium]
MESYNFVSFCGIFILLGLAWLLSADRKNLNWRLIVCGLGLQLLFGLFVFVIPAGAKLFLLINDVVISVIECAAAGSRFMFGRLALPPGTADQSGVESLGFFFAFQALPTIIFFSALMSILYYVGIMPWIISKFAVLFSRLMKLSGAESLCAASNIFVGIEASFAVRPYLLKMTPSEFCTVLTAGMATVASNVLAIYVFTLRDYFPNIAGHLVSAS